MSCSRESCPGAHSPASMTAGNAPAHTGQRQQLGVSRASRGDRAKDEEPSKRTSTARLLPLRAPRNGNGGPYAPLRLRPPSGSNRRCRSKGHTSVAPHCPIPGRRACVVRDTLPTHLATRGVERTRRSTRAQREGGGEGRTGRARRLHCAHTHTHKQPAHVFAGGRCERGRSGHHKRGQVGASSCVIGGRRSP